MSIQHSLSPFENMADNTYYVAAKNLFTRKMSVYEHTLFYVMHENTDSYSKFKPQSVGDFRPKTHYGQIIGKEMLFFYIVDMGVDKEEMEARVHQSGHPHRIRNTNRLSHSLTKRPLKELKPAEEIQGATATKKSSLKKKVLAAKHINEARLLKKFSKKEKFDASTSTLKSDGPGEKKSGKMSSGSNADHDLDEQRGEGTSKNLRPTIAREHFEVTDMEINNEENSGAETDSIPVDHDNRTENAAAVNTPDKESLSGSSSEGHQIPTTSLMTLKNELTNIFKEEIAKLRSTEAPKVLESSPPAVQVAMPGGTSVPEGKVHIGDGVLISLEDIRNEVELKTFDLRKRVRYLLQVFFPDDHQRRCLDPDKISNDQAIEYIAITKVQVAIMSDLLKKMGWMQGKQPDCSVKNVSGYIRKESQRFRDAAKLAAMPQHERLLAIEKLKKRAKELRELNAVKRKACEASKEATKKKKRSDEHESVSEEEESD